MITYDPPAGTHIVSACVAALNEARNHGEDVAFDFNGVRIVARPGDEPEHLASLYDSECKRRADDYRKSPEGIKAAQESAKRLADAQRRTDFIVQQLPGVLVDQDAVLRLMVDLSDCGDFVGVKYDKCAMANLLESHGYKADQMAGLPKSSYNDRTTMRKYLIGQAVSCLRRGMAPHHIIQTFYERYRELP